MTFRPPLIDVIGESRLRAVVGDFYDRVLSDLMIGFFFRGQDRQRLVDLEVQLIARALGGAAAYEGGSLRAAHARHRILDGHFARRRQLLVETLADHAVPPEVAAVWLQHTDALRSQVVSAGSESCMSGEAAGTERAALEGGAATDPETGPQTEGPGDGQKQDARGVRDDARISHRAGRT